MHRDTKFTKIKIDGDRPTSITSQAYGANVGALAFNLDYIAVRKPLLAVKLIELYEACKDIDGEEVAPSSEFSEAHDRMLKSVFNKD